MSAKRKRKRRSKQELTPRIKKVSNNYPVTELKGVIVVRSK